MIFCWPRDLVTVVTTGPLTPLFKKALLKVFLKSKGEKSEAVDCTKISLLGLLLGLGVSLALGLTKVYSKGVLEHELVFILVHELVLLLKHELVGLGLEHVLVSPVLKHELVLGLLLEHELVTWAKVVPVGLISGGWLVLVVLLVLEALAKALALVLIYRLVTLRLET